MDQRVSAFFRESDDNFNHGHGKSVVRYTAQSDIGSYRATLATSCDARRPGFASIRLYSLFGGGDPLETKKFQASDLADAKAEFARLRWLLGGDAA